MAAEEGKAVGLTPEERYIISLLGETWNRFLELPIQHPNDAAEFCKAIHDAQYRVGIRVARRLDPGFWRE